MYRILLASSSPRRLVLLREFGLEPRVLPAKVVETRRPGESPRELVERLASAKGRASARKVAGDSVSYVVIGADTAVVLDDQVLGKPDSPEEAERMLRRLRGRDHEVLTAVFLLRTDRGTSTCDVERTRVRFRDYDDETIRAYVESGEPMDKAGAYGIQGGGGRLVESVEGSRNNVIGLPVERLDGWLARIGIDMRRLAQRAAD